MGAGFSGLSSLGEGRFTPPSFSTHEQFIPPGLTLADVQQRDPFGNPFHTGAGGPGDVPGTVLGGTTGGGAGAVTSDPRFTTEHLGLPRTSTTSGLTGLLGGGGGGGGGRTRPGGGGGGGYVGTTYGSETTLGGGSYQQQQQAGNTPISHQINAQHQPIDPTTGGVAGPGLYGPFNPTPSGTPVEMAGGMGGQYGGGHGMAGGIQAGGKLGGLSPAEKAQRKAEWQARIQARQEAQRVNQAPQASQFGAQSTTNDRGTGLNPLPKPKPSSTSAQQR
jgi:hypothetical protein